VAYLKIFYRLIVRPLSREALRTALMIAAVALGVAVVLAIELAGEAAAGSFRSSVETLAGTGDFEVTATGGVPAEVLARLALLPYALKLRPRIEDYAVVAGTNRVVPFIGVDMLSDVAANRENGSASDFQRGDSIWAGKDAGWKPGQSVRLIVNDRSRGSTPCAALSITRATPSSRTLRQPRACFAAARCWTAF
jgi:putative ABC transport system permease protein